MLLCSFHSPFKTSRSVAEKICDFMIFPNLFRFNKISKQLGEYKEMIERKPAILQKICLTKADFATKISYHKNTPLD